MNGHLKLRFLSYARYNFLKFQQGIVFYVFPEEQVLHFPNGKSYSFKGTVSVISINSQMAKYLIHKTIKALFDEVHIRYQGF